MKKIKSPKRPKRSDWLKSMGPIWAKWLREGLPLDSLPCGAKPFVKQLVDRGVLRTWSWTIDDLTFHVRDLRGKPLLVAGDGWDAFLKETGA